MAEPTQSFWVTLRTWHRGTGPENRGNRRMTLARVSPKIVTARVLHDNHPHIMVLGIDIHFAGSEYDANTSPFLLVEFPDEASARLLASRSVLLGNIYDIWGEGATLQESMRGVDGDALLMDASKAKREEARSSGEDASVVVSGKGSGEAGSGDKASGDAAYTFRVTVRAFGKKVSQKTKNELIDIFLDESTINGAVRLTHPDHAVVLLLNYAVPRWKGDPLESGEGQASPAPTGSAKTTLGTADVNRDPTRVYVGREVAQGSMDFSHFDLKKRGYLGRTPMNSELSLIMGNVALCKSGSLVYDPFAGTGSMLLTAAHLGSMVMGADIDGRIFRGKGKDGNAPISPALWESGWKGKRNRNRTENGEWQPVPNTAHLTANNLDRSLFSNFEDHGLQSRLIGLVTADSAHSPWHKCLFARKIREWRTAAAATPSLPVPSASTGRPLFDAILADPPYGVRAGARKLGVKEGKIPNPIPEGVWHSPATTPYPVTELLSDLLDLAAQLLVIGGRLVYWMPVVRETYTPEDIPIHPALELLFNCEQVLDRTKSRRLIVVQKIKPFDPSMTAHVPASLSYFDGPCVPTHQLREHMNERGVEKQRRREEKKREQEAAMAEGSAQDPS